MRPLRIIIEGGEAFERATLANEIQSNLESCDIPVDARDPGRAVHDSDEHHDHLQTIARTGVVLEVRE